MDFGKLTQKIFRDNIKSNSNYECISDYDI